MGIKYQKDGSMDKVQFCCPDFPYTKKAKKCDRNDKNFGCTKHAKEWKGDGICDLEDCGNCPAMWDKNKFDGGDCGYVEYESAVGQAAAEAAVGEEEGSMRSGLNGCYRHYAGSNLSAARIAQICGADTESEAAVGTDHCSAAQKAKGCFENTYYKGVVFGVFQMKECVCPEYTVDTRRGWCASEQ